MVKSNVIVRTYKSSDRDECRMLWRQLTERHREIYEDPTIGGEHPEDYFDKHLTKVGPEQLWVALHESKVVGLVGLILKEKEAEIEPLIVDMDYRHRGIGKQLIQKVIFEADSKGMKILTVSPVARNVEVIRLLHKMGFRNLGFVEVFMDFSDRPWKPGPKIFGLKFKY